MKSMQIRTPYTQMQWPKWKMSSTTKLRIKINITSFTFISNLIQICYPLHFFPAPVRMPSPDFDVVLTIFQSKLCGGVEFLGKTDYALDAVCWETSTIFYLTASIFLGTSHLVIGTSNRYGNMLTYLGILPCYHERIFWKIIRFPFENSH